MIRKVYEYEFWTWTNGTYGWTILVVKLPLRLKRFDMGDNNILITILR